MCAKAIEFQDVVKRYEHVTAVAGVSFSIEYGAVAALLGGNGAGKTTLLSMLLGLVTPTQGKINVLGSDMLRQRYQVLPKISFMSPYVELPFRLTVEQNLTFYAQLYGVSRARKMVDRLLAELDLLHVKKRTYGSLSAGQRTRVALAKSLLNSPELLVLDEPTASLDPDTADYMRGYLLNYRNENNATLFMASHNMVEVERMCDQVVILKAGRVADIAAPAALLGKYGRGTLEQVFLDVARHDQPLVKAHE
ncbi:MAG: ABC transporter ATP-binding protein [Gammaproteobacteria bacterium]|nr:ABC transporter ATP-binding protein [Gammaproteobacteria bacterium]